MFAKQKGGTIPLTHSPPIMILLYGFGFILFSAALVALVQFLEWDLANRD